MKRLVVALVLSVVAGCGTHARDTNMDHGSSGTNRAESSSTASTRVAVQSTVSTRPVLAGTDSIVTTPPATLRAVLHRSARALRLELALRRVLTPVSGVLKRPYNVAIGAGGHLLATRYGDGSVVVWRLNAVEPLLRLGGPADASSRRSGLAFSADGRLLAYGAGENSAVIWDIQRNQLIAQLSGTSDPEAAAVLRFSRDGRRLLLAGAGVRIYDIPARRFSGPSTIDGVLVGALSGSGSAVDAVFGSDDHSIIVVGDSYFATWSPGQSRASFTQCECGGGSSTVSPDGSTVTFMATSHQVSVWDMRGKHERANWRTVNPSGVVLQLGNSGFLAVGGSTDDIHRPIPTVEVFHLPGGTPLQRLTLPGNITNGIGRLTYDPQGFLFAWAGGPDIGAVWVYELG
jgi:WD40 repeat protein